MESKKAIRIEWFLALKLPNFPKQKWQYPAAVLGMTEINTSHTEYHRSDDAEQRSGSEGNVWEAFEDATKVVRGFEAYNSWEHSEVLSLYKV